MNWMKRFERHCEKGAIIKAIAMAEELREEEYNKIISIVPDGEAVPQVLMNVMEANDRLVFRLKKMLATRFPPILEPRYRRKLK